MRILSTRIFAVLAIAGLAVTGSAWDHRNLAVASVLFALAVFCVGVAAFGRLWCSLYVAGYKDLQLVRQGPYSITRNPLYFFSFIGIIGIGLATETITVPAILAVFFLIYYPFVIKKEEVKLARLFPDQFPAYCRTVPRFFPKTFRMTEPTEYVVNPIIFRRHIASALWFIWIVGVLEALEAIHEMGLLPTYLRLY